MPADKVHSLAVQVMKEAGIDISRHKPKLVTAEMIRKAGRVILMGCEKNTCPIVPEEVADWQIEDPVGKGIEKFREIRDLIREKVEELLVELGEEIVES